jgi:hypothetical protein
MSEELNEVEELKQAVKKYERMVKLFDSDDFKEFYGDIMDIGEDLGKTLVFNYNGIKLEKKDAILNQMQFISGLNNYISGMRTVKEHVDMEYETYLASLEPANNVGEE